MSFTDLLGRNDNRTSDDESELLQEMEDFDSNADEDGSASEVSPTELSDDSESSVEYQNEVKVEEEEDSDLGDSQLSSSDSTGSATPTAIKRPVKRTESDFESCDYCRMKVSTEDCKICICGTVCCDGCFDTVFRCGHLCDFTCEECCEKGIYCNRMAILQCEACSYDHHQRCGCDYINTPDESSDDEEYRKCDYCSVESGLSSMHRCTCGTLCCEDCFPRVEKCGYECTFTCIDCCQGVYCFKENYPQCKHCAEDHLERCGCNDDFSGMEYGSSSNGTNGSESDESDSDEDSDIPYNFIL